MSKREKVKRQKVLVSGCLGGDKIRFNGTGVPMHHQLWQRWEREGRLFHFCPELAAGFGVPRPAAEIVGGTAADVIVGNAEVHENTNNNVTEQFLLGAQLAVEAAQCEGITVAVMTDGSPSCGSTYVDAGRFDGSSISGRGVVTQMLMDAGVRVFPDTNLEAADAYLRELEQQEQVA